MVQGYVDELNEKLNRWETIKKWELLDHDLTVESGELTPSMKVKRNVVEDNYKDVIDGFYASAWRPRDQRQQPHRRPTAFRVPLAA